MSGPVARWLTIAVMASKDKPPRDKDGRYRLACRKLAKGLGFKERYVWEAWGEIAMCLEFELKAPRGYAEHYAWQHLNAMLCKQGSADAN